MLAVSGDHNMRAAAHHKEKPAGVATGGLILFLPRKTLSVILIHPD